MLDRAYLLNQLVNCGTTQLLQVMHRGYAHRIDIREVVARFTPLLPERLRRCSQRTFVQMLMSMYQVPKEEWALGDTQLFLKAGQLAALEELRRESKEGGRCGTSYGSNESQTGCRCGASDEGHEGEASGRCGTCDESHEGEESCGGSTSNEGHEGKEGCRCGSGDEGNEGEKGGRSGASDEGHEG